MKGKKREIRDWGLDIKRTVRCLTYWDNGISCREIANRLNRLHPRLPAPCPDVPWDAMTVLYVRRFLGFPPVGLSIPADIVRRYLKGDFPLASIPD